METDLSLQVASKTDDRFLAMLAQIGILLATDLIRKVNGKGTYKGMQNKKRHSEEDDR